MYVEMWWSTSKRQRLETYFVRNIFMGVQNVVWWWSKEDLAARCWELRSRFRTWKTRSPHISAIYALKLIPCYELYLSPLQLQFERSPHQQMAIMVVTYFCNRQPSWDHEISGKITYFGCGMHRHGLMYVMCTYCTYCIMLGCESCHHGQRLPSPRQSLRVPPVISKYYLVHLERSLWPYNDVFRERQGFATL